MNAKQLNYLFMFVLNFFKVCDIFVMIIAIIFTPFPIENVISLRIMYFNNTYFNTCSETVNFCAILMPIIHSSNNWTRSIFLFHIY